MVTHLIVGCLLPNPHSYHICAVFFSITCPGQRETKFQYPWYCPPYIETSILPRRSMTFASHLQSPFPTPTIYQYTIHIRIHSTTHIHIHKFTIPKPTNPQIHKCIPSEPTLTPHTSHLTPHTSPPKRNATTNAPTTSPPHRSES